jgi:hypothetical protein
MKQVGQPGKEVRDRAEWFSRRIEGYSLVAGVAGVSLLALTPPSQAEIIYKATHHVIGNGGRYKLDLDHDGTSDLTIRNLSSQTCSTAGNCYNYEVLAAKLARGNEVVHNIYGAVAMKPGMEIGPRHVFRGGLEAMARVGSGGGGTGSWIDVSNRYMGVKFKIKGETHYGWARLSVQVKPLQIAATLTGYAYETIPNKPIIAGKTCGVSDDPAPGSDAASPANPDPGASLTNPIPDTPQPASLGMLALGARSVPLWRRKESQLEGN